MTASKAKLKIVVRGLPPALSPEAFQQLLDSVAKDRYTWSAFYQGKAR
jgi:regulator of nonsense transcripts 3